ncbi:chemotaxis protein [Shewanella corallii]|uniref:Chemotaxis protein n=1 Tax=Shewanella corallii TaxID=560080 RepID=A0ABT0NBC5_9GAMM|nr:chemotaxis protein [Shewanella corallii]MCL2915662.1 chemotaxis protein [Shewanella corallii]
MTDQQPQKRPYYVIVAQVAAELNKTLASCRQINLTASNAQAASTRIGNSAMGFKVLTHFIDELASETQKAARDINYLARQASTLSTYIARSQMALKQFAHARQKLGTHTAQPAMKRAEEQTREKFHSQRSEFNGMIEQIQSNLDDLKKTLRTANALASVCRIEACRVDKQNQDTFIGVADKVDEVAEAIRQRVDTAVTLFTQTEEKEAA